MPLRRAYQPPKESYRVSKQIKKFPVYEAAKGPYEDGNNAKKKYGYVPSGLLKHFYLAIKI
jgi:hypothetical protein